MTHMAGVGYPETYIKGGTQMMKLRTDGIAWETAKNCTVNITDEATRYALVGRAHNVAALINGDKKNCNLPYRPVIFRLVQSPHDPTKAIGTLTITTPEKEARWKTETDYDPYFQKLSAKLFNMAIRGLPEDKADSDSTDYYPQHFLEEIMWFMGVPRYAYTRIGGLG